MNQLAVVKMPSGARWECSHAVCQSGACMISVSGGQVQLKEHTSAWTTTTTVLRSFFRDHPGEPVPEENFWTLRSKGRLTEADTPTIRLGATPSGLTSAHLHHPPHIFYRPDALPDAQPTVSEIKYSSVSSDMCGDNTYEGNSQSS